MSNSSKTPRAYCRRDFCAISLRSGAGLLGVGLLSASSVQAAKPAKPAPTPKPYRPVRNWPEKGVPKVQTRGLGADTKGRLYVAGDSKHPIILIAPDGKYLGCWGKGVLQGPHGVRVHKDTVWVTDVSTHQAHQFTLKGKLLRSFGKKNQPGPAADQFNKPTDFAFGPDGAIYISDGYVNTRVVCLAPDGSVRKIWGRKGSGPGQFSLVHAIAIDRSGRVYVADRNNNRVQIFDLKGKFLTEWKQLGKPYGLHACADGSIFFCGVEPDSGKFSVKKLNAKGKLLAEFGSTGKGPGQFLMAHSIHACPDGAMIVADGKANRLQKFST
ncbi:MAG: peptidyl-alpha-hydroxyglycine alpha-amidating lyase family protein [Phycisphaerae bacterium]|jgi:DNA-binding beta-propeller fold protein YncE|nr:peptidyl-alpha-hydroxyglycine alpha-amidating lyase family protein [Phycisphaerae bacterium]